MKLLEYEAKKILAQFDIPLPKSTLIRKNNSPAVQFPIVLKSQVPIGGRGKAGGIIIVSNQPEYMAAIAALFERDIKGFYPTALLAEEMIGIQSEHYISFVIDRNKGAVKLIAHKNGGVEVEENTASFLNAAIDDTSIESLGQKVAAHFGYNNTHAATITALLKKLTTAFTASDATLLEINPLIYTKQGTFIAGDCKMELDDAAAFRHPEWQFEDTPQDTNFVTLDSSGTVATIANGAGLAMATVDAVKAAGMQPANFLDIGGGATAESVLEAFRNIQAFPSVRAIVINIFAGITRCDQVAQAIIAAKQHLQSLPPLYIRLAGTQFEEAASLLAAHNITTLASLDECLALARESVDG